MAENPDGTVERSENPIDAVWADVWNPEPNVWSPSESTLDTTDETGIVGYQEHTDITQAAPMSEEYGYPTPSSRYPAGTVQDVRKNLLTDVQDAGTAPPPLQIVQHEVHTYESGSELFRVRQRTLNALTDSVLPVQLLETNPNRKRALIQILPGNTSGAAEQTFSGGASVTTTVPAGQAWTLQTLSFLYTADGVAGNRTPTVTIKDAKGNILWLWSSPLNVAAAGTQQVTLAPGSPSVGGAAAVNGPLPALTLLPGYQIVVAAVASDPGDTITGGVVAFSAGGGVVYIGPRDESSSAATQAWWKLVGGNPPVEVKTQSGIDCLIDPGTSTAVVQVIEELIDPMARQPSPGIV